MPRTPTLPDVKDEPGQSDTVKDGQIRSDPVKKPTKDQLAAAKILEDDAAKRPVIVKLARIMGSLPELKPEGVNAFHKYSFIKDTQVSGALRKRLAEERIMIIPDVVEESWVETKTAKGGISWVTKLKVHFTAIDGDSGDEVAGHGFGYGDDTGDKGANKAFTAALKYWLMKLFEIGGEDLEDDTRADERASDRQAGSAASTGVTVTAGKIEGVERGGRSTTITAAQKQQIAGIYRDLELTPLGFVDVIDHALGDNLVLAEDEEASPQLNRFINKLAADDAGKLISYMVELKDEKAGTIQAADLGGADAES